MEAVPLMAVRAAVPQGPGQSVELVDVAFDASATADAARGVRDRWRRSGLRTHRGVRRTPAPAGYTPAPRATKRRRDESCSAQGDVTGFVADPTALSADELPGLSVTLTGVGGRVDHQGQCTMEEKMP
jgi:hypothetical protein